MSRPLPVIAGRASAAAHTAFCAAKVEGPGGHLWIDGNGKITAGNGTIDNPLPNALSLPPGNVEDRRQWCPGSTPTCRASCYTSGIEAHASEVFALYAHNGRMVRDVVLADEDVGARWCIILGNWITENAPHGFRLHVSGDVFNAAHALWIATLARCAPRVQFWIYTRSFEHVEVLNAPANLTVNLSCDVDNYAEARRCYLANVGTRLCYLTIDGTVPEDLPHESVIFPDYSLRAAKGKPSDQRSGSAWWQSLSSAQRAMVCPVDFYGKSETLRCGPCRRCIDRPDG